MTDIELSKLSDHDLLITIAQEVKHLTAGKDRTDRILFNSGFGIIFQVRVLWLLAGGGWALFLVLLAAGKVHL
jgi:hypothetical protein